MVRWYHLIISAYGFWLPNDPRGSWSDFVGAWELLARLFQSLMASRRPDFRLASRSEPEATQVKRVVEGDRRRGGAKSGPPSVGRKWPVASFSLLNVSSF